MYTNLNEQTRVPLLGLSYFEDEEYGEVIASPNVWVSPPEPAVDWFSSSIFTQKKIEIPVVTRELCEFDLRVRRIKEASQIKISPLRWRVPRYVDPKTLPWAERFRHWALSNFKGRSDDFAATYGKLFNRGGFNRRIYQTLVAEERQQAKIKEKQHALRRSRLAWLARMRKSWLVLSDSSDEDVPSFGTDDRPDYIPRVPKPTVDSEEWYNPHGVYNPTVDSRREYIIQWKRTWRCIFSMIKERKGEVVYKSPQKMYVDSSDPQVQMWASRRYQVEKLEKRTQTTSDQSCIAQCQSATARTDEVKAECSEAGNTIFIEQSGKSVGRTVASTSKAMSNLIPDTTKLNSLTSRDIIIDTFEWKDVDNDTELKSYSLPAALVKLRSSNPTVVPFNIHTFTRCDFIIRIRANPNPFQIGQLQCSWLYDPLADKNISNRSNVYTLSQANHCLVNAGTGNIGEIYVKYINPLSALPTIKSSINDDCLNLGKLYIRVLNRLKCPDTVAKSCYVTVSIELVNATYSGAKDLKVGDFAYPQMNVAGAMLAVGAAEKLLQNTNTPNNDKPPYQGSRMSMVPQSNQSFCLGTGLTEPINALRLDASGQHVSTIDTPNEMTVESLSKVYGLVVTQIWKTTDTPGDKLRSFDASPIVEKSHYSSITLGSDTSYRVPPVGVISSLFSYWSGELRMRLDFIASKFHTGRLLICYVPLYLQDITLDQAYSYPFQVFDLREGNQSFTFNIPYLSMLPMYPRRVGYTTVKDGYMPPGKVHIFVLNSLVAMENVSPEVEINIYWAAGDNFKCFIPAQPSLVTTFFPDNKKPTTIVKAAEGMYPWHLGFSSSICQYQDGDKKFTPCLVRYSWGWDDITIFENVDSQKYYKLKVANAHYAFIGKWKKDSNDELEEVKNYYYKDLYFVPIFHCPFDMVGKIFGVCLSDDDVKNYFAALGTSKPYYDQKALTYLAGMTESATSGEVDGNPEFVGYSPQQVEDSDFVNVPRVQADERRVGGPDEEIFADCKVYPVVASLNKELVGEDFNDLKTLCRRYQPYGLTKVTTTTTYGDALVTFPALPTGLDINLNNAVTNYSRYVREGPQQVVLSGFRYYSGGMRFAVATTNDKYSLWVQHRPDYEGPPRMIPLNNTKTASNLLNAGYAQYLQSLTVNNIVQFEVPYYKNRNCLYAQRIKEGLKRTEGSSSLGQIYIGLEGQNKVNSLTLTVFSSFADDFQAYAFQGFPPMFYVDDLQKDVVQTMNRQAHYQMPLLTTEVTHNIKLDDSILNSLQECIDKLSDITPSVEAAKNTTCSIFSDLIAHIGHCALAPTKSNIAWSLVHMFAKYGLLQNINKETFLVQLLPGVSGLFSSYPLSSPTELNIAGDPELPRERLLNIIQSNNLTGLNIARPQADDLISTCVEIGAVIVSLIAGFYNVRANGTWWSPTVISQILSSGLTNSGRNYHFVINFFKNVHILIKELIERITCYLNPKLLFAKFVQSEPTLLSEWQDTVERICDVRNEEEVFAQDSPWAEYVEEAYLLGVQIGSKFFKYIEGSTEDTVNLKNGYGMYSKLFTRLCEIRADMHKRGVSAVSRREPFCIWVTGPPGIGKSQLSSHLIPALLKHVGISYKGESTFTIQSGVDYWNGIRKQPCLLIDDFLSVDTGTMKEQALQDFLKIKSPSQLNPNMAAIQDKNLRIAPELFYLNCNRAFPEPIGVDKLAFWRRRDVVVEASLIPELADKFTMLKDHEGEVEKILQESGCSIAEFDHLNFRIYNDVTDKAAGTSNLLTYKQLRTALNIRFKGFFAFQMTLFKRAQEAYQAQWTDDQMPYSLTAIRNEHRRAMEFLATHGPGPNVSIDEFFKICRMVSRDEALSEDQRKLIIKLRNDSVTHFAREARRNDPGVPPEPQPSTSTAHVQCPLIRRPHVCPDTDMVMYELLEYEYKALEGSNLETVLQEFKEFTKFNYEPWAAPPEAELTQEIKNSCMQAEVFEKTMIRFKLLRKHYDYREMKVLEEDEYGVTKFKIEVSSAPNQNDLDIPRKYNFEFNKINLDLEQPKFKMFKAYCSHELAPGSCTNRYCNFFLAYRWKKLANFCECHKLEEGSVWDPETRHFTNFDHAPIDPFNCTNPKCLFKREERYKLNWLKHNQMSVRMGRVPSEWSETTATLKRWFAKFSAYIGDTFFRVIIRQIGGRFLGMIYDVITIFVPWFSVMFLMLKLVGWLFPVPVAPLNEDIDLPQDVMNELIASGDTSPAARHFSTLRPQFRQITRLQSCPIVNQNTRDIISKIKKNTYMLSSETAKRKGLGGWLRVFFVYQNNICFQRHYWEFMEKYNLLNSGDWIMTNNITGAKFPVDPSTWKVELPQVNQLGYARVTEAPMHRSLLSNIASEKAHEKSFGECLILHITDDGLEMVPVKPRRKENITVCDGKGYYKTNVVYAYNWSSPGYCCSILINPNLQQPIIGVHVAGDSLDGYAEPISNSMFSEWIDYQVEEFENECFFETSDLNRNLKGDFVPLGKLHPSFAKHESGITRETPSLVSGKYFPVATEPAPLKNNDPRFGFQYSPLFEGVNNMFKPPKSFPTNSIEPFSDYYCQILPIVAQPICETRVRTLDEAILGVPGLKYFDGIDMRTSEGFPLSRRRPAGVDNKSWLFKISGDGEDRVCDSIYKPLLDIIQHDQGLRKSGIKPFTIFEDCLKDSRLPHDKVLKIGKTRIFSTSPIQFTLIFKCYFMDFMAAFMNSRFKLDHAIGIVSDGPEWAKLVEKLHSGKFKQNNFLSGDYKNFGPTLSMQAMKYACRAIMRWCKKHYGDTTEQEKEDNLVRRILLHEIVESIHLCHDNIYQTVCGAPSGSPITVILNEMVNEHYMYAAYHLLATNHFGSSEHMYSSVDNYNKFVKKCGYGDDIIMNVDPTVTGFFNHQTISKIFSEYRIGYTDAYKDESTLVQFKPNITGATFLKRGFIPHPKFPGQWLGPLNLKISVQEVINWMSTRLDPVESTTESIMACSANAYGHGPKKHGEIRRTCYLALDEIKSPAYLRNWDEWDTIHFKQFYPKGGARFLASTSSSLSADASTPVDNDPDSNPSPS